MENLSKHTVGQIMNKAVVTVDEKDSIADGTAEESLPPLPSAHSPAAAKMMRVSKISAAPVLNTKGELVGIVSRTGGSPAISIFGFIFLRWLRSRQTCWTILSACWSPCPSNNEALPVLQTPVVSVERAAVCGVAG